MIVPLFASLVKFGVEISPPKGAISEYPKSSATMSSTLGCLAVADHATVVNVMGIKAHINFFIIKYSFFTIHLIFGYINYRYLPKSCCIAVLVAISN